MVTEILHYAKKCHIPLDKGFDRNLVRIRTLLNEIGNPHELELLKRLKNQCNDNLTELVEARRVPSSRLVRI